MDKCECYHVIKTIVTDPFTRTFPLQKITCECWGTKEKEECKCEGLRSKCDFYPEVKLQAQKENIVNSVEYKLQEAIKLLTDNGYKVIKEG